MDGGDHPSVSGRFVSKRMTTAATQRGPSQGHFILYRTPRRAFRFSPIMKEEAVLSGPSTDLDVATKILLKS